MTVLVGTGVSVWVRRLNKRAQLVEQARTDEIVDRAVAATREALKSELDTGNGKTAGQAIEACLQLTKEHGDKLDTIFRRRREDFELIRETNEVARHTADALNDHIIENQPIREWIEGQMEKGA